MFRIEFLKLWGHPQLGSIELNFSEENELKNLDNPYATVIIGPNGTGKSFILRTIADIFTQFKNYSETGKRELNIPYRFHLRYYFNGLSYEIITGNIESIEGRRRIPSYDYLKDRPLDFGIEKKSITKHILNIPFEIKLEDLKFPERLIVNSIIPSDRFLYKISGPNDFYQYLGARSTRSTSSTKSSVRRTIKHVFNASVSNNDFKTNLKELLTFLEFEESLNVEYKTKINSLFFSGQLTKKDFRKYFETWWDENFTFTKRKENNPIWSLPFYNKLFKEDEDLTDKLVKYLNDITKEPRKFNQKTNSRSRVISIDLFDESTDDTDIQMISYMENLDIINLEGINLNKNNKNLSTDDISSGEYNLIISMIGIFANIKPNSLVLIDEPEISLHPNWQMRYMTFLKQVFSKFSSCHFVLTTHSHFLISDLEGKTSSIIGLNRVSNEIQIVDRPSNIDTFGWSAEEVLLKVFKVATSRNYYVAEKLGLMLDFIASEKSTNQTIKEKFIELELDKISGLTNEDPLKTVYDTIVKEYVS